jgi:hypothetical protein
VRLEVLGRDIANTVRTLGAGAAQPIRPTYLVAALDELVRVPGSANHRAPHRVGCARQKAHDSVRGVDLDARDVAVFEQLLNVPDIAAVPEQMDGEGMA